MCLGTIFYIVCCFPSFFPPLCGYCSTFHSLIECYLILLCHWLQLESLLFEYVQQKKLNELCSINTAVIKFYFLFYETLKCKFIKRPELKAWKSNMLGQTVPALCLCSELNLIKKPSQKIPDLSYLGAQQCQKRRRIRGREWKQIAHTNRK